MTPPNCWSGNSDDYGDSGGVYWQGEQGRGSDPGPDPDPDPGGGSPSPSPGHHKGKVSAHGNFFEENWLILAGVGVVLAAALFVGARMRNSGSVGGLIKDGVSAAVHGSGNQYAPVAHMGQPQQGPRPPAMYGATGTMMPPGSYESQHMYVAAGSAEWNADGRRKKKKKKKSRVPTGGDEQRIVVIDPVTGKKKVKRKVRKGSKSKSPGSSRALMITNGSSPAPASSLE